MDHEQNEPRNRHTKQLIVLFVIDVKTSIIKLNMYYLLYGENYYLIKKKVMAIKEKFLLSDPSSLNLAEFSGINLKTNIFWSAVLASPFLAKKRLIIVKNLLLENKDDDFKKDLAKNLVKIPDTSLVFFIEDGNPDKRGTLFKALNRPGVAQKFEASTPNAIRHLIDEKIGASNLTITNEAIQKLILYVGSDSYRAENEIIKLILYSKHQKIKTIDVNLIEDMVKPESSAGIFDFVDAIGAKNQKKAVSLFEKLIENGENELYILSMIVYQFRNMIIISDYMKRQIGAGQIASLAKIHPFVVQKTISILRKYNREKLIGDFFKLGETDFAIKSGQIDSKLSILLLISEFCKN